MFYPSYKPVASLDLSSLGLVDSTLTTPVRFPDLFRLISSLLDMDLESSLELSLRDFKSSSALLRLLDLDSVSLDLSTLGFLSAVLCLEPEPSFDSCRLLEPGFGSLLDESLFSLESDSLDLSTPDILSPLLCLESEPSLDSCRLLELCFRSLLDDSLLSLVCFDLSKLGFLSALLCLEPEPSLDSCRLLESGLGSTLDESFLSLESSSLLRAQVRCDLTTPLMPVVLLRESELLILSLFLGSLSLVLGSRLSLDRGSPELLESLFESLLLAPKRRLTRLVSDDLGFLPG